VSAAREGKHSQTEILFWGPCGGEAHRSAPPPPQGRRSHAQRMLHQIARLFGVPTAGRTREPGNRATLIKPPDQIKPPRPASFRRPDPFPVLRHRQAAPRATATRHCERDIEMEAGR
jgi:hypothetical protein